MDTPAEYSKHPVREKCDRARPVSADRTLPASGRHLNTGSWVELTEASGQLDQSVRSPRRGTLWFVFNRVYKYFLHSCEGVLLLIPTAEKHVCECQEEQGPSEVIEI